MYFHELVALTAESIALLDGTVLPMSECELVQNTGKRDREQTDLYEGDIVLYHYQNEDHSESYACYYVAEFQDGSFGLRSGFGKDEDDFNPFNEIRVTEIIVGNCFQHPDLLDLVNQSKNFSGLDEIRALGLPYQSVKNQQIQKLLSQPAL
ncbi:hypothetical protein GCM10028825_06130 [Spirosoma agri]